MSNGKSRSKGKRGELDVAHRIPGAKRTGHSYFSAPDLITKFAAYEVKNRTVGGATILEELERIEKLVPNINHYVVFKAKRGAWLIAERLEQHVGDHGEAPEIKDEKEGDAEKSNRDS